MTTTSVLVLSGSLRADAVTTRIALVAQSADIDGITAERAKDLDALPFYNEDLDIVDAPPGVVALRQQVEQADGILFVSPANNGSISAVLKNAIDWLSRPRDAAALQDKPAALLVAGYSVDSVESHLEHVLRRAGARVIPSPGRALSLKSFRGRQPADVPAVVDAVVAALAAVAAPHDG